MNKQESQGRTKRNHPTNNIFFSEFFFLFPRIQLSGKNEAARLLCTMGQSECISEFPCIYVYIYSTLTQQQTHYLQRNIVLKSG